LDDTSTIIRRFKTVHIRYGIAAHGIVRRCRVVG